MVDATTFRYLINLVVCEKLEMSLMDIITTYLYVSFNNDIYMKTLEGLRLPERYSSTPRELYSIKKWYFYGLKQIGRI